MDHEISAQWLGNLAFEAQVAGHTIMMDARPEVGGEDRGTSPKRLLLTGLAGCTGIDIGMLIKKMRLEVEGFTIDVGGDLTQEDPKVYHQVNVIYTFKGKDLDHPKLERAVQLSWDKYCGVAAMLKKATDLSYEIRFEE
ncbi:putative redox protein [Catalinimonas alkaloidigena]|uniref:Putative redox protein n=1 Tax=Catalinimonas alkaloidigena TaxID=1075417 RepID=A0A1G8ZIS6_9BACT|nr:OsmC family protein [Catalinimonas alkaloidigena]SDK15009.1 putative redox protein [Catalinimonas alkaloidigena]